MKEPIRWRDDPALAADVRAILQRLPRARPLDTATRTRMGRRLGRYLAMPLVLTSWLTMKTAAASLAITAGAVGFGAVVVREVRVVESRHATRPTRNTGKGPEKHAPERRAAFGDAMARSPIVAPSADAVAAFPDQEPSEPSPSRLRTVDAPDPELARAAPPATQSAIGREQVPSKSDRLSVVSKGASSRENATAKGHTVSGGGGSRPQVASGELDNEAPRADLKAEAAMLELARRALASSPAEALAITAEHHARFPKAALGLEREFIQVEALRRLGRKGEARMLAESLRQRGGLYSERVDRLIEKIDGVGD